MIGSSPRQHLAAAHDHRGVDRSHRRTGSFRVRNQHIATDLVTPSLERGELAWAALNDGLDIAWNAIVRPSEREDSEVNKMVTELSAWIKDAGNPELR
jgi:hypothetical protein